MQTGGKALHIAFDIIKIIAVAIWETGKGFFEFLWECLPTFADLKQTLEGKYGRGYSKFPSKR